MKDERRLRWPEKIKWRSQSQDRFKEETNEPLDNPLKAENTKTETVGDKYSSKYIRFDADDNKSLCPECSEKARGSSLILTEHHPECSNYNLEKDLSSLIKRLIRGIECWAADEDGVHDDCWNAYAEAKIRLGEHVSSERT